MTKCNLESISVAYNLYRIQVDNVNENERTERKRKRARKRKRIIYFSIERKNFKGERVIFDAY